MPFEVCITNFGIDSILRFLVNFFIFKLFVFSWILYAVCSLFFFSAASVIFKFLPCLRRSLYCISFDCHLKPSVLPVLLLYDKWWVFQASALDLSNFDGLFDV